MFIELGLNPLELNFVGRLYRRETTSSFTRATAKSLQLCVTGIPWWVRKEGQSGERGHSSIQIHHTQIGRQERVEQETTELQESVR